MVCVSVACTVLVIRIARNTHKIPRVVQKIISNRQLLSILSLRRQGHQEKSVSSSTVCPTCGTPDERDTLANYHDHTEDKNHEYDQETDDKEHVKKEDVLSDWKEVAVLVDRCLLLIFLSFSFITILAFLVKIYIDTLAYREEMANHVRNHNATELIQ